MVITLLFASGHLNVQFVGGGFAVGVYGHQRFTGDLDIWLNPSLANA